MQITIDTAFQIIGFFGLAVAFFGNYYVTRNQVQTLKISNTTQMSEFGLIKDRLVRLETKLDNAITHREAADQYASKYTIEQLGEHIDIRVKNLESMIQSLLDKSSKNN